MLKLMVVCENVFPPLSLPPLAFPPFFIGCLEKRRNDVDSLPGLFVDGGMACKRQKGTREMGCSDMIR